MNNVIYNCVDWARSLKNEVDDELEGMSRAEMLAYFDAINVKYTAEYEARQKLKPSIKTRS